MIAVEHYISFRENYIIIKSARLRKRMCSSCCHVLTSQRRETLRHRDGAKIDDGLMFQDVGQQVLLIDTSRSKRERLYCREIGVR